MTSSGKVRIYELSKDLGLDNKDVLDAAEKLSIAAKSHSSSISDDEASRIRSLIGVNVASPTPARPGSPTRPEPAPPAPPAKAILAVKKAAPAPVSIPRSGAAPVAPAAAAPPAPPASRPPAPRPVAAASAQAPARPEPPAARPRPAGAPVPARPRPVEAGKPAGQPPTIMGKPAATAAPAAAPTAKPAAPGAPARPAPAAPARPAAAAPPTKPLAAPKPTGPAPVNRASQPPVRVGSPQRPPAPAPGRPAQAGTPTRPPATRPQLVGRPQPGQSGPTSSRPAPPSARPQRPGAPAPIRPGSAGARTGSAPGRPGPTPLELVGKPIRRDSAGPGTFVGGPSDVPPAARASPRGCARSMAPGELIQLQKPTGCPGAPPPRRPDHSEGGTEAVGEKEGVTRPTATPQAAPRRPGFGPPTPAGARAPGARRPDWDDSAKLEALRSRTPQKQRQKVHIIGENDDALTAETGGYAGEQEALVLQASLARPAKPRTPAGAQAKPTVAVRKRKKETTRQRQRRRAMELRASREAKALRPEMLIVPEGNLTVQELADRLGVESSEIIKSLFFKGIIATVTQTLDLHTIETVSEEFGVPVLQDDIEAAAKKTVEMIEESDMAHLIRRPPVVTVMGHVDHGKTSLLDAIRKTRVAAGEAGGITQHIGAYQVDVPHGEEHRKITFLDTPGHEAFTAMRARGTKVTDVAVLVVAADDGVRPQTLEAISHARAAEVPIVVAINKIDKEGAQPDRVKQELSGLDLVAEDWGGNTVMVPVSAIKGENIDKLLEMILLVTEVEDLQANPDRMARGTVIEAHLDKAKGPVATLLIQNGTLKAGDVLAAGPILGKVRAMVDDTGKRVKQAGPSSAVEALGFSEVPTAGDEFEVYADEKSARAVVGDRATEARATRLAQQMASRRVSLASMSGQASEGELKELNLILKADVQGSVEAILGSLEQLPQEEVQVRVLLSAPGEITETDVDLAAASGAVIVGFNTSMASGAKRAADATGVDVRDYDVIYKLLEDIQMAMEGLLEPEMVEEGLGEAEVRAVFTIGKSAVAGCYVTSGKLQRNCRIRVHRGKELVYEGDLDSLRRNKDDVKEVATGFECGIGCDRFTGWQDKDRVEAFKLVTQRRTLST
ncbi:translation initiation factor IF-2 [Cyanobium gracile]|uniref:Translation initiation factor IF-2 n=1 Tax=Cyanobium gracile (strain ATCC 27147 / PCC 6307) TaxID=292564 RepID=K9PAE1_CYAGP|nr:translation initiation factor IF-2 [Cyanobium gracile]AFY30100.1 translation initiation factor IF-2 [Cyanobium gracile PCC 6307]